MLKDGFQVKMKLSSRAAKFVLFRLTQELIISKNSLGTRPELAIRLSDRSSSERGRFF